MKKADLDFENLGFKYRKVNANIRYYFQNGDWDSGTLSEDETVNLHVAATCLHYGQNVFEGMKVFETKDARIVSFRPDENYKRLKKSAEKVFMEPVPEAIFFEALERVIEANKEFVPPYGSGASLYVRPILLGITPQIGLKTSDDYLFMMMVTPVGPYFTGGIAPVKMLVVEDLDRAAPFGLGDVKVAGNYAAGLRGVKRAKSSGYTDVIYLDAVHRKYIDESGPANFIAITKDGTYVTPASASVLPSITNMTLKTIAEKEFQWKVEQRPVSIEELDNFAEAGCCGTAAVITPVGTVHYRDKDFNFHDNGKTVGPKIKALYDYLTQVQTGDIPDKYNWLRTIKL